MTEPTLAHIPALHAIARRADGQKTLSRRSMSAIGVVLVHILMLYIFWIKPILPKPEPARVPMETIVLLSPANKDMPAPPELKDKEEPKGNGLPQTTAPLLIPPPVKLPTQQERDAEVLGGLGRALACTAGQFEYLAESARRQCADILVPWTLDRERVLAGQFKPTDPNIVLDPIGGADTNRQLGATADPCVGLANNPVAIDSCRRINPKGTGIAPNRFGIGF